MLRQALYMPELIMKCMLLTGQYAPNTLARIRPRVRAVISAPLRMLDLASTLLVPPSTSCPPGIHTTGVGFLPVSGAHSADHRIHWSASLPATPHWPDARAYCMGQLLSCVIKCRRQDLRCAAHTSDFTVRWLCRCRFHSSCASFR